jgi:hypothetical protein
MTAPYSGHDAPTTVVATSAAPSGGGGKVARRVLLAAAGVGLCGAGVALTPYALQKAEQYTQAQVEAEIAAAVSNARQQLLNELGQLEGVSIDVAIEVATLTKLAVKYIVGPVASLLVAIGEGALDVLISALNLVLNGLHFIPGSSQVAAPLKKLRDTLMTWKANLALVPQELTNFATWDIDGAEAYLMSLKKKIAEEQNATPTPTVSSGY